MHYKKTYNSRSIISIEEVVNNDYSRYISNKHGLLDLFHQEKNHQKFVWKQQQVFDGSFPEKGMY